MRKRVLITDGVHEVLPKGLKKLGYSVDYHPAISLQEVRDRIGGYEGLVINSKIIVDQSFLDLATELKWLGRLGSGLEIIDRAYAKTKGVAVYSSPQGNAPAVGEHALAMVLCLANKLLLGHQQVTTMAWDREAARGWELKYKTIGLAGYGHTGPAFAKTLRGFATPIFAYDKYKLKATADTPWVTQVDSVEELLSKSEVFSLHLPATTETHHFLDESKILALPKGAIVINTSRGSVVDLEALIHFLESGHLGGACLDVFPNEKPATYSDVEKNSMRRLSEMKNVVLSPHVAGWTRESKHLLAKLILQQVQAFCATH